jgi:hypothetical protein
MIYSTNLAFSTQKNYLLPDFCFFTEEVIKSATFLSGKIVVFFEALGDRGLVIEFSLEALFRVDRVLLPVPSLPALLLVCMFKYASSIPLIHKKNQNI